MSSSDLEVFFAYRSLHSDESWGAVLGCAEVSTLPNIDFGITVYARNEKEAVTRARDLYERIHQFDSDRNNVREFAKEAFNSIIDKDYNRFLNSSKEVTSMAVNAAVEMNDEFKRYFEKVGKREIQSAKDAADYERTAGERKIDLREGSSEEV